MNININISFCIKQIPAKYTAVYETYWKFAAERQKIFFKRFNKEVFPWTADPILLKYKFTNVYRAADRVSQYLIRNVIYNSCYEQYAEEIFFRIILFKLFNKIETWELFVNEFGIPAYRDYSFKQYDRILSQAINSGKRIFSAAYIMPSGNKLFGHPQKHRNCLKVLEMMMNEEVPLRITEKKRMQDTFDLLKSYPMIGDFLAYQFATDINYSELTNFSEKDFVVAGPGAKSGIHKCFKDSGGLNDEEIIRVMTDRQEKEFERLGLEFKSLWGRELQFIDCQNIFCEVDKYARLAHPEFNQKGERTRIKQLFRPNMDAIDFWFPPKWNINEKNKGEITCATN
jgi:hypothetical protein